MREYQWLRWIATMVLCAGQGVVGAAPTPKDAKLADDGITLIECAVRNLKENCVIFSHTAEDPTSSTKVEGYHYKLYLPKGYSKHPDYRYPCFFIASAGGNAGMGRFDKRFKRDEWIVVMLQESKNGSPDWLRNFTAAYDDVVERVRVANGLKFATGYSGGSRCASVFTTMRPGFAGLLCEAAGFAHGFKPGFNPYQKFPAHILVAGTFGDTDMNYGEGAALRRSLKQCWVNVQYYKGGHGWCTPEVFDGVMDWMEDNLFLNPQAGAGRHALPAPADKTLELSSGHVTVKAEPVGEDACRWYFRKYKRALAGVTDKAQRTAILTRLTAAVTKGGLAKDLTVNAEAREWQTELTTLQASPEFKAFDRTVHQAFLDAQKAESSYTGAAQPSHSSLQSAIQAYQTMVEKYPDSYLTPEAQRHLVSLEIEAGKLH